LSQNHFTLSFPLKSPSEAYALAGLLPPLMRQYFVAADEIGTIHYSRFTILSEKTLLFLGDFDGEFGPLMADLAERAGPLFDLIFQHVDHPPSTPIATHVVAFIEWAAEHLLPAVSHYSAYADVTAQEINAQASDTGVDRAAEPQPYLLILPTKSRVAFFEVQLLLRVRGRGLTRGLDSVGTLHFAQFVPLEDNQIGFFTIYDGNFDGYVSDVIKGIGQVFDLLFKFTKGAPPLPSRNHLQEFTDFAAHANRTTIGFYQAYPGLSVQAIHGLTANKKVE
jgi:hypothetical protein